MLKVEAIDVSYDDFHVLHGVSLAVPARAAVGIVGQNGHGKSTLLQAVCGLIPIRSGRIWFKDEDVTRLSAPQRVSRGLAYIAEDRRLFGDMTVIENLLLGAYVARNRQSRLRRLEQVFALYPRLAERKHQLARTLSGGEAQMVALGRGLMSGADCLAIDEPSLGLSPILTQSLMTTIEAINKTGVTIVLVEQSLSHRACDEQRLQPFRRPSSRAGHNVMSQLPANALYVSEAPDVA